MISMRLIQLHIFWEKFNILFEDTAYEPRISALTLEELKYLPMDFIMSEEKQNPNIKELKHMKDSSVFLPQKYLQDASDPF